MYTIEIMLYRSIAGWAVHLVEKVSIMVVAQKGGDSSQMWPPCGTYRSTGAYLRLVSMSTYVNEGAVLLVLNQEIFIANLLYQLTCLF